MFKGQAWIPKQRFAYFDKQLFQDWVIRQDYIHWRCSRMFPIYLANFVLVFAAGIFCYFCCTMYHILKHLDCKNQAILGSHLLVCQLTKPCMNCYPSSIARDVNHLMWRPTFQPKCLTFWCIMNNGRFYFFTIWKHECPME